ncbi:hypothetical protein H0H87_006858 [Tephrocybe sp. NHM501043]|nr:hypothetical protein H0H87_006858 [Tephrocybe sp. NHM501043]
MATPAHYLAIIDAGTTSTSIYVFEWDGSDDPSTLHEVNLGNDKQDLISAGGVYTAEEGKTAQMTITANISPIVVRMTKFFDAKNIKKSPVHVFLLGTGLRQFDPGSDTNDKLRFSYETVQHCCSSAFYNIGTLADNALLPTSLILSAFSWAGLVYDRRLRGQRSMFDIPSALVGKTIGIISNGGQLILQLGYKNWRTDPCTLVFLALGDWCSRSHHKEREENFRDLD